MKKYIALITIAASVIGFSSCQKAYNSDPDRTDEKNPSRGTFTCKINGEPFEGEFKTTNRVNKDGVNFLSINAIEFDYTRRKEDYKNINMTINWYDGPKEYALPADISASYVRSFTDLGISSYMAVNDENNKFILTEYGGNTIGTFVFTAVKSTDVNDTVRITEGVFDFPND